MNCSPLLLAGYETTTSYPGFLAQVIFSAILQSIGVAMLLVVIVGSGEVMYRERFPQHLAFPRFPTKAASHPHVLQKAAFRFRAPWRTSSIARL